MRKRSFHRNRRRRTQVNWRSIPVLATILAVGIGSFALGHVGYVAAIGQLAAAASGLTKTSPASCEIARQKALGKEKDPPAIDTFVGEGDGKQILSDCYGAIITEEGKKAKENPKKYGPLQAIEKHYKCVGREIGTVTVEIGKVTSVSMPGGEKGKCPKNVVNKGLNDKPKGDPKDQPKQDDKGKEGGKPEMPKLPEPPKDDGKKETGGQKCETEEEKKNKINCPPVLGSDLLNKAWNASSDFASNVVNTGKETIENLWANLTGADDSDLQAFDEGSIKAADDIQPSSEAQMQELSNEMKTLDPESQDTSQTKTNPDTGNAKRINPESNSNVTGFGAPSSALTPIQTQEASTRLRGMEQTLFNIIQYLDRIDSAGWWI